jgi:hypothetical protein
MLSVSIQALVLGCQLSNSLEEEEEERINVHLIGGCMIFGNDESSFVKYQGEQICYLYSLKCSGLCAG